MPLIVIVDFPIKTMVYFHGYVTVYKRVTIMKHTSDHHFPATSDHREKKKPGPVGGSKSDKPSHGATSSRIWVYPIMFGDKNSIPIWRNCHFGGIVILEYTNSVFRIWRSCHLFTRSSSIWPPMGIWLLLGLPHYLYIPT